MKQLVATRIELTAPAKKQVDRLSNRMGITQVALLSRLVEFLVNQDLATQAGVLSRFPTEIQRDVVIRILKNMAEE